jgi:uncharacterized repeat protein (TIGR01451 family)
MLRVPATLVWSAYPYLMHLQVKEIILNSADRLPSLQGLCVTGGGLNLYNANALITYPPTAVTLAMTDDVNKNCVMPSFATFDSFINYTIYYDANGFTNNNVTLTDYLPDEVNFISASDGGAYVAAHHSVVWPIKPFTADSNGYFTVRVKVKSTAPQGQYITNFAELVGDNLHVSADRQAKICDASIVFVDKDASTGGDGLYWITAYKKLQDALTAIRGGSRPFVQRIWIAAGAYKPTDNPNQRDACFAMINGIDVFGHFAGGETSIDQRNPADANNETILTGDIDDNNTADVCNVVLAAQGVL